MFLWTQIVYNEKYCPPPTRQEIEWLIKKLKNNKSSELDGIQSVILKALNGEKITYIHKLMEHIWEDEHEIIPKDWNSIIQH